MSVERYLAIEDGSVELLNKFEVDENGIVREVWGGVIGMEG